jgi:hypothetical protein
MKLSVVCEKIVEEWMYDEESIIGKENKNERLRTRGK